MTAIETVDLRRVYETHSREPDVVALNGLSLSVEEGMVQGLLGPNGAGKTTLVKILSTVLLPTSGHASVLGYDVVRQKHEVRPRIGIVFGGDRGLYWRLTGRENLEYWAALYHVPQAETKRRVDSLLERVGLTERADYRVETYSRGMKQRLHLARGLIADARMLFLDEPTTGMDPVAAHEFRDLILELRSQGRTILLTTHDMAEAEALCDAVAFIDRGQVIATETPRSFGALLRGLEAVEFEGAQPETLEALQLLPAVSGVSAVSDQTHRVEVHDTAGVEAVLRLLVDHRVTSLRTARPTLEDLYLQLLGGR
ncbi:MAG: ABC transporter ATP-binding protein [Chloroflexota bacterium]